MWEIITSILMLFSGVGVFIAGMNMMSDGLEKSAGAGMKKLLGKITNNHVVGVGIGAAVTAIIQSSAATTVMAIGLVNAGIMTLMQAVPVIMGANIGTTVTGILVSLKDLPISTFVAAFAFIGAMMTFFKKEKVKRIGSMLCGFGMIFVGLDVMSSEAAFGNDLIEGAFQSLFSFPAVQFPLLLIIIGVMFTALIQSSSAATGVVIVMVSTGAMDLYYGLFIVLGSNIGTCVTALLSSIGTSVNAKRTAIIHLIFNLLGTAVFTILIWSIGKPVVNLLQAIAPETPGMQLAWFHVIFNVTTTVLLLPFVQLLVKLATLIIKEKPVEENKRVLKYVDDRLLSTPPIALMQAKKEIEYMASLAKENMQNALLMMQTGEETYDQAIRENEAIIDFTNSALTRFLIKLSALVGAGDEKKIGAYFHVLNDLERIGDHAENLHEIGVDIKKDGLSFSENAISDLQNMHGKVMKMFEIAEQAFDENRSGRLAELTHLENEVDGMKRSLTASHFARLAEGNCKMELSPYFSSAVSGLERVADHLINVGYSILNPTGSQSQAIREDKVRL